MSMGLCFNNLFFTLDCDYLTKQQKDDFKFSGIDKVQEISNRKTLYKKMCAEDPSLVPIYQKFKGQLKRLRESKLPFRCIDYFCEAKKNNQLQLNQLQIEENGMPLLIQAKVHEKKLRLLEKVNWLHGTNSSILSMLPYTDFTLIPTGKLLNKGIAPMSGEISKGGMDRNGVNQFFVSVDTIRDFSRCWRYAVSISHSFSVREYEAADDCFIKSLGKLKELSPDGDSWDTVLITLTRLKQWKPEEFSDLCKKYAIEIETLITQAQNKGCEKEYLVLKALNYDETILNRAKTSPEARNQVEKDFPKIVTDSFDWGNKNPEYVFPSIFNGAFLVREYYFDQLAKQILSIRTDSLQYLKIFQESCLIDKSKYTWPLYWAVHIETITGKDINAELTHEDVDLFFNKYVRECMETRIAKKQRHVQKRLDRLIALFKGPSKIRFTEEQKKNIENPLPMLLASTKQKSMVRGNSNEFYLNCAQFGKDIDLVFVKSNDCEKMKKWLIEHNLFKVVSVESIETFTRVLEDSIPLIHANFQVENLYPRITKDDHGKLEDFIVKQAAPLYKAAYPDGTVRKYHDARHAAAVYFFANCIAELYKEKGMLSDKNAEHLLASAFLHDAARQNDGVDFWDKESGKQAKQMIVKYLSGSEVDAEYFGKCIAEKDNKNPYSLDQKIIHDADCMEIVRCLYNPEDFKIDELWIFKDLDPDVVMEFVKEAKELISLTMKPEINAFINQSDNPVKSLVQIVNFAEENKDKFRFLNQLTRVLGEVYLVYGEQGLSQSIEQTIMNS